MENYNILAVAHPPDRIHPDGIERPIHIAPYRIERPAQILNSMVI